MSKGGISRTQPFPFLSYHLPARISDTVHREVRIKPAMPATRFVPRFSDVRCSCWTTAASFDRAGASRRPIYDSYLNWEFAYSDNGSRLIADQKESWISWTINSSRSIIRCKLFVYFDSSDCDLALSILCTPLVTLSVWIDTKLEGYCLLK